MVQHGTATEGSVYNAELFNQLLQSKNIHISVDRSRAPTIVEVLEQQGRSAGLPDAVISSI
ncbi:hypothetical protein KIN20_003442 [Parelaphostrongylus tenuis]|uniref:Uncharacterized protein n=1 Tax=Parelaphostrongylus tenuis TaxID=148309 RepID=A0AAD5MPX7_PARTN|nr:hypothetical protein KIN20_003442 [Parelaphostrongylus tenuis]